MFVIIRTHTLSASSKKIAFLEAVYIIYVCVQLPQLHTQLMTFYFSFRLLTFFSSFLVFIDVPGILIAIFVSLSPRNV